MRFFFRFWLWPHHRNPHEILHKFSKLHPYRTTQCRNMTSYRFFQMLDAAAQYYFRFRICWCYCQKVKDYQQTKFRWHISIDGLGITTSVFEKQTSAIVEFYIRFWCQPHRRNLHVVLHQATEFRPNRSTRCENMTSYPFLKISAATAKYCFRFRICWRFWRFGLIFTPLFGKFLGHIFPIWRHPLSWAPKGPVVGGNTSFEPFSVRISAIVWAAWARAREKIQDNKKVTKVIYFPYFGEAPTGPIRPKCCIVGDVLSRVRRIKWNLHGLGPYDFTGVEFSIFLLIFARALQQRSANALPVMTLTVYVP